MGGVLTAVAWGLMDGGCGLVVFAAAWGVDNGSRVHLRKIPWVIGTHGISWLACEVRFTHLDDTIVAAELLYFTTENAPVDEAGAD